MSWSLKLANGDLSIGSPGLNTVQGSTKVVQDLACACLEPMGTDPINPSYGSILDGGVDTEGTVWPGYIGDLNDTTTAAAVQAEIQRIVAWYQQQQIDRNTNDLAVYGRSTLSVDEAVLGIAGTNLNPVGDKLNVLMTLQTGANTSLPVSVTIGNSNTAS